MNVNSDTLPVLSNQFSLRPTKTVWFREELFSHIQTGIKGTLLYKKKTRYQNLKIYDTEAFGKLLLLDNVVQTTEKDEFIYHEMMTHPVLLAHPCPKNILVIGAGDGGILREVLKYNIDRVTIVEIDEEVIKISKQYLPSISQGAFDDKRVTTIIDDGAKFIQETKDKFDVVIVDSPDPSGVAKVLFSTKFYKNVYNILNKIGFMIRQTGSTMLQPHELKENLITLKPIFPHLIPQVAAIPTYIGGFFSFIIASKTIDFEKISCQTIKTRYNRLKLKTKYYNPEIHFASLVLPNYIRREIQ